MPLSAVAHFSRATRRCRSTTRASSSPPPSRSTWRRAGRCRDATAAIDQAVAALHMPADIVGGFAGTAQAFQQSLTSEPLLIAAAAGGLHRAGRAVRELHPPDHHPVHPAIGRRRRRAGADAVQHRVLPHRRDRRHPADRHRQEERHPDDRLRAARRAQRGASSREAIFQACLLRLPPDHHDDRRRPAGRPAAGARYGDGGGAAAAAGHLHRRRPDRQPGADALHHARRSTWCWTGCACAAAAPALEPAE